MTTRRLFLPAWLAASALALAGCGGSDNGSTAAGVASDNVTNAVLKDDDDDERRSRTSDTSSSTSADTTAAAAVATTYADDDGRLLASNCFNCHGTDGVSSGGFDRLAGESVGEIVEEMHEMQVEDEGIMTVHALGYTDEQIQAIAEYFASR